MFKKGDKVIALVDIDDKISKGTIGICNKDQYDTVYVEVKWDNFDQGWGAGKAHWNVEDKHIKLYQESIKTLNKDTVKVGQKVKVIADDARELGFEHTFNNERHSKDYIGIITSIDSVTTYHSDHKWVHLDGAPSAICTMLLELLEEPKNVIEYVECIKGYNTDLSIKDFNVVGKIYKVESYNPKTEELKLKGFTGSIAAIKFDGNSKGLSTDYKISTKAEFDLQNTLKEEKPEVLVFGKFKIGSIVVSCKVSSQTTNRKEGDIFKILETSSKQYLKYKSTYGGEGASSETYKNDWRQASPEEVKAFEQGITTIKDMKVEENLVGRYLKTLVNNPVSIGMDIGEYLLVTSFNTDTAVYDVIRVKDNHAGFGIEVSDLPKFEVMPIGFTPESQNTNTMEYPLITEAKRRYPVGSKAQCLVTKDFYPITEDVVFKEQEGKIFSYTNYGKSLYHKHYDGSTWAEVKSKQSSEEFKVGDWVTILGGTCNWCSGMNRYVGKTVQITEYKTTHLDYNNVIRFKDDGSWTWETTNKHYRKATPLEIHEAQKLERDEYISQAFESFLSIPVEKLEVPYKKTSDSWSDKKYPTPKECYTKLPIVTSVKRSNIVPLKLEKQKSLINLPTI